MWSLEKLQTLRTYLRTFVLHRPMDPFPVLVEHCTQVSPAQLRTDPMCPYSLQAFMSLYVDNGVLPDGVVWLRLLMCMASFWWQSLTSLTFSLMPNRSLISGMWLEVHLCHHSPKSKHCHSMPLTVKVCVQLKQLFPRHKQRWTLTTC